MAAGTKAHGQRMSASRFCSTRCRDCVLALEALNPSPLASYDFLTRRALLTDRLIHLWRSGMGPDPALVVGGDGDRLEDPLDLAGVEAVLQEALASARLDQPLGAGARGHALDA